MSTSFLNQIIRPFVAVLLFSLFSCSGEPEERERTTLTVGYLAISGALPTFVAEEFGLFENEGLNVELVQFNSSNEIAVAAIAGRIDFIAIGATNAVLDASTSSGTKVEAFLLNGYTKSSENEKATDYLLGRPGITMENLEGKTVAFFPGSISRVFANLVLPKYNVSLSNINYIEMAPPNWLSALESGTIDAVTAIEPFAQQILSVNAAEILIDGYYAEAMPDVPLSAAWFVGDNVDESDRIAVVQAYKAALAMIKEDKENALTAFDEYTAIQPDIYKNIGLNNWRIIDDSGAAESLKSFVELLEAEGEIEVVKSNYLWRQ